MLFLKLNELEEIGYQGFAFVLCGDNVELVGTTSALERMNSEDINYLHALITVGEI